MKWFDKVRNKEFDIIAKKDLIDGAWYEGICRNASKARWSAEEGKFIYMRYKFGYKFEESIEHPEDEIERYDVFIPLKKL